MMKKSKHQKQVRTLKRAISIENVRGPAVTETELNLLDRLAKRVIVTTTKAMRAIDKALKLVAASERRIERLTSSIKKKPARTRSKTV